MSLTLRNIRLSKRKNLLESFRVLFTYYLKIITARATRHWSSALAVNFDLRSRRLITRKEPVAHVAGGVALSVHVRIAKLTTWWMIGANARRVFQAMLLIEISLRHALPCLIAPWRLISNFCLWAGLCLLFVEVVVFGVFGLAKTFYDSTNKSWADSAFTAVAGDRFRAGLEDPASYKKPVAECEKVLDVVCSSCSAGDKVSATLFFRMVLDTSQDWR